MEISLDRYYNRTSDNSHSDYKTVLFRAGDALQSAEMNEAQGLLKREVNSLSRKFARNGEIISGLEVNTTYTKNQSEEYVVDISVNEGIVFIDGDFVAVEDSSFQITSADVADTANFSIGVKISYSVVDELIDSSLLDPAIETRNYGQSGASRLKVIGQMIAEELYVDSTETEFLQLFTIADGEIFVEPHSVDTSESDKLRNDMVDVVASYDRNSNGNYLLDGHEVTYSGLTNPFTGTTGTNVGPFWFNVADGSSNVDGYNYIFDSSRMVELGALVDYELKQNEPQQFIGDGWYSVRHTPVRKMFRISGVKTEADLSITHGSFAGANDEIPSQFQPVSSLSTITQGATTFIQGTDYSLVGDTIYWLNGGNEPAPSSTYYVTFNYQYSEIEGNFSSNGAYSNGDISPDKTKIYLFGFSVGSQIQYDYDFVLDRVDSLIIKSDGSLSSIKGVASEDSPRVPDNDHEKTLKIAEIKLSGDNEPIVTASSNRTFKMEDIQILLDEINTSRYDIGRLALEMDIIRKQPGATMRGQLVDNFSNNDFRDEGLENSAICIEGNLIMDIDWITKETSPVSTLSDGQYTFEISSTSNVIPVLKQEHYTRTRKVNSYLFTHAPAAKITISPSIYRWVDKTNYITHTRTQQATTRISDRTTTIFRWLRWHLWTRRSTGSTTFTEQIGSQKNQTTSIVPSRTPSIIPPISLKINSNFGAFNANEVVDVTIDDRVMGTLVSDSNGTVDGYVGVPSGTYSGSKRINLLGRESDVQGSSLFRAEPLSKTITNTVTNWWRFRTVRTWQNVVKCSGCLRQDPVAQTFMLAEDTVLDKVEVQFEVKSQTDVTCVICETTAGMPDKTKTITTCEVKVGDLVNVGSRQPFVFENKETLIGMKEYAFIIVNSDPIAELQVAKLGEKTIDTPVKWLTDPAYMTGVLFSSANNSAWTPHQEEDLRFWLYDCTFNPSEDFVYSDINVESATDLMLLANAKETEGTSVSYEIELLDRVSTPTLPNKYRVNPYDQIPISQSYDGRVRITAKMKSNGLNSPKLDADVQLSVGSSSRTSVYTSVGTSVNYHDSQLITYIDMYEPQDTNIQVQVQIVDPATKIMSWKNMIRQTNPTELGNGWKENKFIFDLQNNGSAVIDVEQSETRVRIIMNTSSDEMRPVVGNLRFNTTKI